ncbi:DUF2487 family protein [Desmospora profundinema]|uniref:DUF2487 family protein n=1 Tax=Desmospora profundinema TaxID=1571184 RepID=A0ABU1II91_9BACL|nr:DUF2487 family protein [Desmospora profundinema]MDR6224486.1 hypothetical protein [Desmospora profundinema]
MRLSQVDPDEWNQLAAYVDTVLLPVYRIRFPDKRLDVEEAKRINRVAAKVEAELQGRLLLTSPIPYTTEQTDVWHRYLEEVVHDLAASPFPHVVILAPAEWNWTAFTMEPGVLRVNISADEEVETAVNRVIDQIVSMWQTSKRYDSTDEGK